MGHTHELGKEQADVESRYNRLENKEARYTKKDDKYSKNMADMVEYVKWITTQTAVLR